MKELWFGQGWNLTIRRLLFDWEVPDFANILEQCRGLQEGEHALNWQKHRNSQLSIKKLNQRGAQLNLWPWKHIWSVKIPYKMRCFTWLVAREAVLTQEILEERGIWICSSLQGVICVDKRQRTICFYIIMWLVSGRIVHLSQGYWVSFVTKNICTFVMLEHTKKLSY